ncbi:MAG: helix-turn-helix transcriptional regulator [Actinomycetota bacterium]|nr:helix-turn-helix transcriptional regulator [Actinomycetota bacterium]
MMSASLAHTLAVVGDRWTLQVVADLFDGPKRFGELAETLAGISPNVLTARLRQLERDGLVVATPYSQRPIRLAYALSDSGRELGGAISLLSAWGARQTGESEGPVHGSCGTPLETRLYCPTCERPADDSATEPVHWM